MCEAVDELGNVLDKAHELGIHPVLLPLETLRIHTRANDLLRLVALYGSS